MLILRSFKHILQYNMLVKFVFWRSCPCDKGEYCEINCGYFVIMACIFFSIYTYFDRVLSGDLHDIYEHLSVSISETRATCVLIRFYFSFFFPSPEHPLMKARGRSILGGEKQPFQEYTESGAASRFANCAICVCSSFAFLILYVVYSL